MIELKRETIEVRGIRITVQEANGLMAARREVLAARAYQSPAEDEAEQWMRAWVCPILVAATVAVEGVKWPLEMDELMALPDEVIATWLAAAFRLNPHWLPKPDPAQDLNEKKGASQPPGTPTSG